MSHSPNLYAHFDFRQLDDPDFKEDSVREELILPLLRALGYGHSLPGRIQRAKKLRHPMVRIGSRQRSVTSYPDYLLTVNSKPAFILDAKSPRENIQDGANVEQAYFYAIHPDVRSDLYVLCNGRDLTIFHIQERSPLLSVPLKEIDAHFHRVAGLLSATNIPVTQVAKAASSTERRAVDYLALRPPTELTNIDRQTAKRHFGVHGYFTKQPWKVVQSYIQALTQPGDLVLDPYGGTGVTLIEALMLSRRAIHVDINPLSIFIVTSLLEPIDYAALDHDFSRICAEFDQLRPKDTPSVEKALRQYPYPRDIALPRNSDVQFVHELFTPKQLAELALLKYLILRLSEGSSQRAILLMFSGLLNKINRTYHASEGRSEGRGDSGVFRYYRYRVAPDPADLDVLKYFHLRYERVVGAKRELQPRVNSETLVNAIVRQGTAADLPWIPDQSVDYIFTDPPYGAKIPYLDLSVMWNAWLDLPVAEEDYAAEAIEGGEQSKSKESYAKIISRSISEMSRVLKYDRWMSFVFAHQTPSYWYMIVESAEAAGFEYAGAVRQKSGQVSFKKRQNPFTVLSGELIINFRKVRSPRTIARFALGAPVIDLVINNIEAVIARNQGATIEEINDELIIRGLELGFLDLLAKEYADLTPLLLDLFDYDEMTHRYHIRSNTKFKSQIPLELRVRYFVVSALRRAELAGEQLTFDEIVLHVMPLLKNGVTPENETILKTLTDVAERVGDGRWRLQKHAQFALFH